MKLLVTLTALLGAVIATSPPRCPDNHDCVQKDICYDGVIQTDGGGGLDLRSRPYEPNPQCFGADYVCCRIPGIPDPIPPTPYHQCHRDEDCVNSDSCHNGVISTDGSGLLDLRFGPSPRTCAYQQVCCRKPDVPEPLDYCPDNGVCVDFGYCAGGVTIQTLVQPTPGYSIHDGPLCYLNPGEPETGVCCGQGRVASSCKEDEECVIGSTCLADAVGDAYGPGSPPPNSCYAASGELGSCCKKQIKECPLGDQCTAAAYCDATGHISAAEIPIGSRYGGQECYIGFSLNIGVCCKPVSEPPVPPVYEPCPTGKLCTPYNYCGADGSLTPTAHSGPTCTDCLTCSIGVDTDSLGVCCGPAKPQECAVGNECTSPEYCDPDGYVVSKPSSTPYSSGQECSLAGGYGGYGVCCNPNRPPAYCPIDSECVPQEFCYGSILEANTENTWSTYDTPKTWQKCDFPGVAEGGVCCKTTRNERECGKSYYASQKLDTRFYETPLDKLEADFGEFPWQAIVFYSNYTFKCGASLISDRHLLTVAHCVDGIYANELKIRLGDWQVNAFDEPLQYQDVDVSAVYVHPEFKRKNVWNNIAIIELKQRVNYEYNINDICLPGVGGYQQFAPGTRCIVAGWGKDSFTGNYQHILKKIEVPLIEHGQCQNLFRKTRLGRYFRLHESYLCAGGEEGIDACTGDGGGPLICLDELTGTYTQVGITAWGIGCGTKDVPGAYTDVAKFAPWIESILGRSPVDY